MNGDNNFVALRKALKSVTARDTTSGVNRSFEIGHVANPAHAYLAYSNLLNNWHPAITVGLVHDGMVHVQTIPIWQFTIDGQLKFVFTYAGREEK